MLNPFHVQIDATVDYCQEHLEHTMKLTTDPRLEARFKGLNVYETYRLTGRLLKNLDELLADDSEDFDIDDSLRLKELRSEIRNCNSAGQPCDCKDRAVTQAIQALDRRLSANRERWVVVNDGPRGANAAGSLMLSVLYEQVCHLNQSTWRDLHVSWDYAEVLYDGEQLIAEFTIGGETAVLYIRLLHGPYAKASHCNRDNGPVADSELVFLDEALVAVAAELYQNGPLVTRPDFIEGLNRLQTNGFAELPESYRMACATIVFAYANSPDELMATAMARGLDEITTQRVWILSAADALVALVSSLDEQTVETINTLAPTWAGLPSDLLDVARASTSV